MLDKTKTDSVLGHEINNYLIEKGVQTPFAENYNFNNDEKIVEVAGLFAEIMRVLGLDLTDDSLRGTPKRIGKMFIEETYYGLDFDNFPKITTVENKMKYNKMVIEKDITLFSQCEHHFVQIYGKVHIGYIPQTKVLGLSKLNRIVDYFARRPQIQERIGAQIFYALEYILGTSDIALVIEADHFCVKSRGINDINSTTTTSEMGGVFMEDNNARQEFLQLIRR